MEPTPLLTVIKIEPPEVSPASMDAADGFLEEPSQQADPLLTEIKLEPVEVERPSDEPPPATADDPKQQKKGPKPLRRMKLSCEECGKVCSSAGFLNRHKQYCNPPNADGMIQCKLCPTAFRQVIRMKYHMNWHKGIKAFKCRNKGCEEAFFYPETRYNHEEDCRTSAPTSCAVCGATFQFPRHLRAHMVLHEEPRFECQICNKKCFHRRNLRVHWLTHFKDKAEAALAAGNSEDLNGDDDELVEGEEPVEAEPATDEGTSSKSTGEPAKVHFCELCGKSFPVEEYLQRHKDFCTGFIPVKIDLPAGEENPPSAEMLTCLVCGKREKSVEALKTHIMTHEKGRYKCGVCDRDFGTKSILSRHLVVHTDERNHLCEVCDKGFKTERAKNKHIRYMHTAKPKLSCNVCSDTFTNTARMRYHMNKHTGECPYKCRTEGCGQAFPQPGQRHRHEESCGRDPRISCQICGATFKARKYYHVHMARHNANLQCSMCDKKYAQQYRLKAHMAKAHQIGEHQEGSGFGGGSENDDECDETPEIEEVTVKQELQD